MSTEFRETSWGGIPVRFAEGVFPKEDVDSAIDQVPHLFAEGSLAAQAAAKDGLIVLLKQEHQDRRRHPPFLAVARFHFIGVIDPALSQFSVSRHLFADDVTIVKDLLGQLAQTLNGRRKTQQMVEEAARRYLASIQGGS